MSLRNWWRENLEDRATTTWITHASAAVFVPFALSFGFEPAHRSAAAAFFAVAIALVFQVRERVDRRSKIERGEWRTPGPQGVSGLVDEFGDLLGPYTAAAAYFLGAIL